MSDGHEYAMRYLKHTAFLEGHPYTVSFPYKGFLPFSYVNRKSQPVNVYLQPRQVVKSIERT